MSLPLKRTDNLSLLLRFIKYDAVGVSTFILDLILIKVLSTYSSLTDLWMVGISFVVAASINYAINRYWSFKQSDRDPVIGYWYFIFILAAAAALTIYGTNLLLVLTGWPLIYVRVLVAAPVGVWNFLAQSYITFRVI